MPNIVKNRGRFSSAASMSDTATITIGAGTADQDFVIFSAPTKCVIDSFSIIANASSTAQTVANHMNFQFTNATQSEDLLSTAHSLAGADLTADTAKVISTNQNSIIEQNDVILFKNANTGTGGVTQFSGIVQISTRYRPA